MNAKRHQRIKEIFGELCDQSPVERRARLHAISNDDPDLAHDVEVLLKHSDTPAFDLEDVAQLSSLVGEMADGPIIEIPRPLRIGMYDIIDQIGQGGMGVVYLAQQHRPLERHVAIKVIRPGMDSRQVLTRFDMERRTLAAMNHPCIAAVHDAGVTDEGRPYFVMQHVQGERITTYCDTHTLTIDERLDLFLNVCEAITHAHQKGVIHRDLKPSNILIEERDGIAVPKVIDFGVAKAMSTPIGEETLHTSPGQLLGTPQYMSPEQTQLDGTHVDTRSDIFSLGALLYELLCGNTPIDAETIRSASFDQVCRMIRETEPVPPSRRIEQLEPDDAMRVAQHRHMSVSELVRTLRGELDWITRTAMEKEPQRRYESVSALAADIRRYRRHEPVIAGPMSAGYRMKKFVRRHRGAALATCAVVLAIVGGAAAVFLQARETAREADNNRQIVDFLDNLFTTANPTKGLGGTDMSLREFVTLASERLRTDDSLPDEVRASLHNTVGATFAGLGDLDTALSHFRDAWTLYERSIGMADSRPLRVVANLVHALDNLEEDDEALQLGTTWLPFAEETLGPDGYETRMFYTNMAILYEDLGRFDDAEHYYRTVLDIDQRIEGAIPATWMRSQLNLATFLINQRRIDEGAPLVMDCIAIAEEHYGPDHPETLLTKSNYIVLLERTDRLQEAAAMNLEVIESTRRELGAHHPATLRRIRNQAVLYARLGRFADAELLLTPLYPKAVAALGAAHPDVIGISELLTSAIAYQNRIEEAANFAITCYDRVLDEVPADHGYAKRAAMLVANAYDTWEKPEEYHEWLIKAGENPPSE